ncbi:MAG: response regulator [Acidobacteriota bacterium]|nr:response regulator [Acidobacteriota bacterium]
MEGNKVLLVDDDELIRSTLCEVLGQEGFEVTSAANVPEALKLITSNVYDVLLSDLHMPGAGDGLTVMTASNPLLPGVNPRNVPLGRHPGAAKNWHSSPHDRRQGGHNDTAKCE